MRLGARDSHRRYAPPRLRLALAASMAALSSCASADSSQLRVADSAVVESQRVGQLLPRLSVATFSSDSATIGGAAPQPITLVNLWATYCGPCIEEMPALAALQQRYAKRGLRVLAVSVDRGDAEVKAFLLKYPLSLRIGRDPTGTITAAIANTALPQNLLIDADGRLLYRANALGSGATPLDTAIDLALAVR